MKIKKNSSFLESNLAKVEDSCNKKLSNHILSNSELCNIVEVIFKGGRKEFYSNSNNLNLKKEDYVVVESNYGYDIGKVHYLGTIVKLKLKKKMLLESNIKAKIIRMADLLDLERLNTIKKLETNTLPKAREIVKNFGLTMKITDIEFRGDLKLATFFYTANSRIDFRELILLFAEEFKVKVIMWQISVYEEMSRHGSYGTCGREFCFSSWQSNNKISDFNCCLFENYKKDNIPGQQLTKKEIKKNEFTIQEDNITRFD